MSVEQQKGREKLIKEKRRRAAQKKGPTGYPREGHGKQMTADN